MVVKYPKWFMDLVVLSMDYIYLILIDPCAALMGTTRDPRIVIQVLLTDGIVVLAI
jgi:hypothetical protein